MKSIKEILSNSRGRIGFAITVIALVLVLFGTLRQCHAAEFGITGLMEVTHREGSYAGFVDLTGQSWSVYGGQWRSIEFPGDNGPITKVAGGEYRTHIGQFYGGVGLAYLTQLTPLNGTQLNFSLTAGLDLGPFDLLCRHISHGSQLGIAPDKPNASWNWCGVRFGF